VLNKITIYHGEEPPEDDETYGVYDALKDTKEGAEAVKRRPKHVTFYEVKFVRELAMENLDGEEAPNQKSK
jgi:hypothetical protein